ncbi:CLUMA_CG003824, isoform A [Clunio marinus]|uniref:CLUMA_CG003824, isoform A n=1 Tax=Clunio marinus TaxID=568069 RepID=A0A1J1HRE5_9DIPT|nr:CLUMA_CG003824, isoform A [Clunio marinus]
MLRVYVEATKANGKQEKFHDTHLWEYPIGYTQLVVIKHPNNLDLNKIKKDETGLDVHYDMTCSSQLILVYK